MAISDTDILYSARNLLRSELNKTHTGFFLRDYLLRSSNNGAKIANNKKLLKKFLNLIEQNSAITVSVLVSTDTLREEKLWVYNPSRHMGHPFPRGYEEVVEEKTKPLEVEVQEMFVPTQRVDAQETKTDPRPEPSPVVYTTKAPEVPRAFASLQELVVAKPDAVVEEAVINNNNLPQEKEPVKMTAAHEPVNAATLMERAKEMIAAAERMEKIEKMESTFTDIREAQLDIARNSAIILRLNEELLEASENLNKASEKLRALVQGK